jgi:hypothetical protein
MSAPATKRYSGLAASLTAAAALTLGVLSLPVLGSQDAKKSQEAMPAEAPVTQEQQNLPAAEEVLRKYVEATGGAEAYQALKTQHATGKFSMPAQGMEGTFELFQEQPDKFLALVTLPGMGQIQTGLNGTTGWRTDPMQGPRLLEGEELQSLKRDADMQAALKPEEHFEKMEVKGIEDVNGEKAYHLVFTPKGSANLIDTWYSVESGLQLKTASAQDTPMGKVKFENLLQDYRPIGEDGKLQQPHKIVTTGGGAEYVVTLDKVETNVELPADRFALPEEVKQLQERKEQAPQD